MKGSEETYNVIKNSETYDKLFKRENDLLDRLDNLEGCEDNPVYAEEIKEIRKELDDIRLTISSGSF